MPNVRHVTVPLCVLVVLGVTVSAGVGCSGKIDPSPSPSRSSAPSDDNSSGGFVAPPTPAIAPQLPDVTSLDHDGDRIDDLYFTGENKNKDQTDPEERISVEAIFRQPITTAQLEAFVHEGGVIRHVFRAVSYGFTGWLPRKALRSTQSALGSSLLLLKADRLLSLHLNEATSNGRARPVWAKDFAGSATGFNGSPTINIGFLDTGIDPTHPDLAGRMVLWKDYTSEALTTGRDIDGHGSHVVGVALGSGASFGVGPGTLHYTDTESTPLGVGGFWQNPVHLPAFGTFTSTATWTGGGVTDLAIVRNDDGATGPYTSVAGPSTGGSPQVVSWNGPTLPNTRVSAALKQNASSTITQQAIANSVTNFPAAGDGLPLLRGVAPLSHWAFAKIFAGVGVPAASADMAAAIDDLIAQRVALNVKVVNMSFGINTIFDVTVRAKTNTMVANGIVVVASNGNSGPAAQTADPGRAANAITVGATNDINELTDYTTGGFTATGGDEDNKPDILAPGGSLYRSRILSVDSNSADAKNAAFADVQANDYTSNSGTSVAAPFVSGSAALVIGALEQAGTPWSFGSEASPFLVKTLLLASATETNTTREVAAANPPTLGRSAAPKDLFEGYGMINTDAAVEAAKLPYDGLTKLEAVTTPSMAPSERRAWGRHVAITPGQTLSLSLVVAPTADYDLYLYSSKPGQHGNPVILLAADKPVGESETLTYTVNADAGAGAIAYLFVKRVGGNGAFSLSGCLCAAGATCFGTLPPCVPPPPPPVDAGPPDPGTNGPNPGADAAADGGNADSGEEDGCSCRTIATRRSSELSASAVSPLFAALLLLKRRYRRRRHPPN